jgi:DNA-binding transcriptional regulator LsrR (DeoR family)
LEDEASLATRAAWLHYAAGLTQAEVAARLNIQSTKAHRLIARANREGLIRVFVDGDIAGCVALEQTLSERYGLEFCEVAPDIGDESLPLKSLGLIGARYLRSVLERGEHKIIGVGHGRTLAAAIDHLPRTPANGAKFVSLLGGVTRKFAANPFDVIHRIAERTGAESYVMPVPLLVNTAEDKAVLTSQSGMRDVLAISNQATLLLLGIGTIDRNASLVSSGMIELAEITKMRALGAAGEALGVFFDCEGRPIESDLTARTLAFDFADGKARKTIAIAGGQGKAAAIDAVLKSGLISGLITDERTALDMASLAPKTKTPPIKRAAKGSRRMSKVSS